MVEQWVTNSNFVEVGEHAPAYSYTAAFKVTLNANGEVVVLHEDEDPLGADFKCLGPKR